MKKNQLKINIITVFKGIVLLFAITMSLFHVYFSDTSITQINHKQTYLPIIKERNETQKILLEQFEKNIISKEKFLKSFYEKTDLYKDKINNYNSEKRRLAEIQEFNGRSSFHYWLFVFGLAFSFFVLALRYTYCIISNHKNTSLKKSFILEASAWMAVSLFWVAHAIFVKNADLPTPIYASVMFGICLMISISTFYFIKYIIHRKTHTLESYRKSIVSLVTLLSDIRINHYFLMAATAMTKDNKEEIEKDVEIVDEKIFSTIENIADES